MLALSRTTNPLVYPGYRLPGFDETHPAAKGMYPGRGVSLIVAGGAANGVINILTGAKAVHAVGNAPFIMDPFLGPCLVGANADREFTFPNQASTVVETSYTQAALLRLTATTTGNIGTPGNNAASSLRVATGIFALGAPANDNGPNVIVNAPCFIAVSLNSASPFPVNWVLTNLQTGAITTLSSTTTAASITPNGSAVFLTASAQPINEMTGNLAAYMWSPAFLNFSELKEWARDPFAFWYPPEREQFIFDSFTKPLAVDTLFPQSVM